jgi:hypothetical protein
MGLPSGSRPGDRHRKATAPDGHEKCYQIASKLVRALSWSHTSSGHERPETSVDDRGCKRR